MMLLPEMNRGVRERERRRKEGGRKGKRELERARTETGRDRVTQRETETRPEKATRVWGWGGLLEVGEEPEGTQAAGLWVGAVGGRAGFGGGAEAGGGSGPGRGEGNGDGRGRAGRLIHQGKDQGPAESLTGGN